MGRRDGVIRSEKVYSQSPFFMKYHSLAVLLVAYYISEATPHSPTPTHSPTQYNTRLHYLLYI